MYQQSDVYLCNPPGSNWLIQYQQVQQETSIGLGTVNQPVKTRNKSKQNYARI